MKWDPNQEQMLTDYPLTINQGSPISPVLKAIGAIPAQFFLVIFKPTRDTFMQAIKRANWVAVWITLFVFALALGVLASLSIGFNLSPFTTALLPLDSAVGPVLLPSIIFVGVFAFFFLVATIMYLLAKLFGGKGTFLAQCYTQLLVQGAFTIVCVSLVLALAPIPQLSWWLCFALCLYATGVQGSAIVNVYNMGSTDAVKVVLPPLLPLGLWLFFGPAGVLVVVGIFILLTGLRLSTGGKGVRSVGRLRRF